MFITCLVGSSFFLFEYFCNRDVLDWSLCGFCDGGFQRRN